MAYLVLVKVGSRKMAWRQLAVVVVRWLITMIWPPTLYCLLAHQKSWYIIFDRKGWGWKCPKCERVYKMVRYG